MKQGPNDGTHQDQPGDMSEKERHQLILQTYKRLKRSFEMFKKPNGEQENPAKTCKDLYNAYPDFQSGRNQFVLNNNI